MTKTKSAQARASFRPRLRHDGRSHGLTRPGDPAQVQHGKEPPQASALRGFGLLRHRASMPVQTRGATVKRSALIVLSVFGAMSMAYAGQPKIPPMPPDAPLKDEHIIDGKGDPVVARCARSERYLRERMHGKLLKVVITHSPKWGTIWRADTAWPLGDHYPPMIERTSCTERVQVERPLEMFDPKQSITPLSGL
jgi:hypothetical protein